MHCSRKKGRNGVGGERERICIGDSGGCGGFDSGSAVVGGDEDYGHNKDDRIKNTIINQKLKTFND